VSQHLEATFENNVVLTDSTGLGRLKIKVALHHMMLHHHWMARYYDDVKFFIEAPNLK
jgi:hypothetical protein